MSKSKETQSEVEVLEQEIATETANVNETVTANPFAKPEKGKIHYIIGEPRQWRADMSSNGGYKIGEGRPQDTLEMRLLGWEDLPQTQLFGDTYGKTDWAVLYFIDPDNQFSTMLLKGYSRENFVELLRGIASKDLNIGNVIITADTKPKQGTDKQGKPTTYRVATFTFTENDKEGVSDLYEFWLAHDEGKLLYSNFINDIKAKAPILLGMPQVQEQLVLAEASEGEVVNS